MNNTMQYKGYTAIIEYSAEDECFVGQVIGTGHTIIFDGTSVEEIRANFQDMIDDYPAMCADLGQEPNTPVSEVMVPVSADIYAKASRKADHDGVPVRVVMETALQNFVAQHA
ncbi:MAG: type II toxin-antitoxin system HicB family antitoxin [Desulfovibrio sp.]|jgi:predicted HicB family RNase H-like nuclease|nr:type II toxin-antitoxin system HicB family antitoxin [Desulfovibrio sp.]